MEKIQGKPWGPLETLFKKGPTSKFHRYGIFLMHEFLITVMVGYDFPSMGSFLISSHGFFPFTQGNMFQWMKITNLE